MSLIEFRRGRSEEPRFTSAVISFLVVAAEAIALIIRYRGTPGYEPWGVIATVTVVIVMLYYLFRIYRTILAAQGIGANRALSEMLNTYRMTSVAMIIVGVALTVSYHVHR